MQDKPFQEMTLDEVYDFDAGHSPNLGRSVVSEKGIARNRKQLSQMMRRVLKSKKHPVSHPKHAAA